eukprot:2715779-Ditylum_brightwellii.AAC.1
MQQAVPTVKTAEGKTQLLNYCATYPNTTHQKDAAEQEATFSQFSLQATKQTAKQSSPPQ